MGTWGPGGFENDAAADFAAGIASATDIAGLFESLPDDVAATLDVGLAQRIVAAAECVAAMLGRSVDDLPNDLAATLATFGAAEPGLVEAARDALSRVVSWSELTDYWATKDAGPFNLAITSLIERLNPPLPFDPPMPLTGTEVPQTCSFCAGDIAPQDLVTIEIRQPTDEINVLDRMFWCHLACLNARLHPRHIVQNWKVDPEEAFRAAERLLEGR